MDLESDFKRKLDRMLFLLKEYNEIHWYEYFQNAKRLIEEGRPIKAKKWIKGAYGGMGSFNDEVTFGNAPKEISNEANRLMYDLYDIANNMSLLDRLFGR